MDFQTFRRLSKEISKTNDAVEKDLEELANGHNFSKDYAMSKVCEVDRLTTNSMNILHNQNKNLSENSDFFKEFKRLYQDLNNSRLKAYSIYKELLKENPKSI